MFVGALADLGAFDDGSILSILRSLPCADEFDISFSRVSKAGIAATKFGVEIHGHHVGHEHHHGRSVPEIRALLEGAPWPSGVFDKIMAVFGRVAEAEGKIHGKPASEVHFHEIGAVDSIVDIAAACCAVEKLGVSEIRASAPVDGCGTVRCEHGVLPVPTPATLEILRGVPIQQCSEPHELITPTGAALLAEFAGSFAGMGHAIPERIGYGAGTRELASRPNVLRAVLARTEAVEEAGRVLVIETHLDDMSPELVAEAQLALLAEGALDVTVAHVTGKKNRSGLMLTALAKPEDLDRLTAQILTRTTAFGVRYHEALRRVLRRETREAATPWGPVQVKVGYLDGRPVQVSPEFEAVRATAVAAGVAPKEVYAAAAAAVAETMRADQSPKKHE